MVAMDGSVRKEWGLIIKHFYHYIMSVTGKHNLVWSILDNSNILNNNGHLYHPTQDMY